MRYIAAYDISDDRRRLAVSKVLRKFGERVQESVFELRVSSEELAEARTQVGILLARDDVFDFFPVDDRPNRERFRWMIQPKQWDAVIFL